MFGVLWGVVLCCGLLFGCCGLLFGCCGLLFGCCGGLGPRNCPVFWFFVCLFVCFGVVLSGSLLFCLLGCYLGYFSCFGLLCALDYGCFLLWAVIQLFCCYFVFFECCLLFFYVAPCVVCTYLLFSCWYIFTSSASCALLPMYLLLSGFVGHYLGFRLLFVFVLLCLYCYSCIPACCLGSDLFLVGLITWFCFGVVVFCYC